MKAATEFPAALIAAARTAPIENSRLIAAIVDGTASPESVRAYATTIASMAVSFPRRIAAVLAVCDHAGVRQSLLSNLLEEEGVTSFTPETGAVVTPHRVHASMAARFARAAGADTAEVVPMPPAAWFAQALERGDWLGAFAFFSVGLEASVPGTFRLLVNPLIEHYGFSEADLEFLTEHFIADERHGIEAAELIARIAASDDERARAITGARRGGMAWRALHRTVTLRADS